MEISTPAELGREPVLARFYALVESDRRQQTEAIEVGYRQPIVEAAGIDPNKLSERGHRVLRWLAGWDEPTVSGVVELLFAARIDAKGCGTSR